MRPRTPIQRDEKERRVGITFPAWMITSLDEEADAVGTTREGIIKQWISEKLKRVAAKKEKSA